MRPRDRLVVVGKTGMGKSTWLKRLCGRLIKLGWRVVVFDPADEYSREGRGGPYVAQGPLRHRVTVAELLERPELLDAAHQGLAVVPREEPKRCARDFEHVARLCRSTGNLVLVAEELGEWEQHSRESVKALATRGRHTGVVAVFCAQRATQIPLTARSQASTIVAFRQDEVPDLAALAQKCGRPFADGVARLRVGQCAIWTDELS